MLTAEEKAKRLDQFIKNYDKEEEEDYQELSFLQDHNFMHEHKFKLAISDAKRKLIRQLKLQVQEGLIDVK